MLNSIQYIKLKIARHGFYVVAMGFSLVFFSCNSKQVKHDNHKPDTKTENYDTTQHSSMKGMESDSSMNINDMTGDSGIHSSHNNMNGMEMNDEKNMADTTGSETYWNALPTNRTVISAQNAIAPTESQMNFVFTGNGYIAFDYRRNRKVPVRIGGRVERLYVKYNYQYVPKGEKILELYSPDINTYIEEFLYLNRQTNDTLLQSKAKQKLLLLGLTPNQVTQIVESGQAPFTISIYSPFEGYVLFNPSPSSGMNKSGTSSEGMGVGMNSGEKSSPVTSPTVLSDNSIREGMYVSKDQTLFWINDFKEAWGIVAFTKENEKYIRKGLLITVTSELMPEKTFQTSIQLIEQVYQGGQKFSQARVYLSNISGILKQNSLITATVSIPVKSLMIPASSVYYLGKVAIVWVRTGVTKEGSNIFQSRAVRIGHRDGNKVEILEGLSAGEQVAKDAGYLADSETIIKY